MKLTNEQTNVIVSAFKEELNIKKEEIRQSEEYKSKLEELKEKHNLSTLLALIEEDKRLGDQIQALQQERNQLRETCAEEAEANDYPFNSNTIKIYGLERQNPESTLINRLENEIFSNFPTDNQIKSVVILETVAGKSDIFESLKAKFLKS